MKRTGKLAGIVVGAVGAMLSAGPALAMPEMLSAIGGSAVMLSVLAALMLIGLGAVVWRLLTLKSMARSSLFGKLFVIVASSSAFFSAVSSAIGFGLITGQENVDVLRNIVLPPAFGLFVFFLTIAIWVGGSELLRHRDWFRHLEGAKGTTGFVADILHFLERSVKLFIVIPILGCVLFFVSTWTSVVGIGGVDAVRYTYAEELKRLQSDCAGVIAYRQKDYLFLTDLELAINDVRRVAQAEREGGGQTGQRGRGVVSDYFDGVAQWLTSLENSVAEIVEQEAQGDAQSGYSPYDPTVCARVVDRMKNQLNENAFENYDRWARRFETDFEDFRQIVNRWRRDRRIERLIDQQLQSFDRANPQPLTERRSASAKAIDRYAQEVEKALKSQIRRQRLTKPPVPLPSYAERYPTRGLGIIWTYLNGEPQQIDLEEEKQPARTMAVVEAEEIAALSTMTPRDAVLKNFNIFSDVWVLAISWDFASYILLLAYLFFPSAERALAYKDLE